MNKTKGCLIANFATVPIKTLPGFPQKINYLRKIDPFVFEELLLEGFEAHGGFVE
ncbi:hypothetical protein [Klebsiella pneumoniae]|uniref:hypothetical protein n=1 Tax=Klebsiella pneumoniae TaxID=573 RepID=UPI001D18645A|nr:hypothetical protein [Klebsiella pneumoniae]